MAVVARVFTQLGLLKAIEERVRFARARMGNYEVIDFLVMLIGYAVSGERTLERVFRASCSVCRGVHGAFWQSKPASPCDPLSLSCSP